MDRIAQEGPSVINHVTKVYHLRRNEGANSGNGKTTSSNARPPKTEVDIVCKDGTCWIKVKAMSAEGIQAVVNGSATPGHKSVLVIADELLEASENHLAHYRRPTVIFHFSKGVSQQVASLLTKKGIIVEGAIVELADDAIYDSEDESDEDMANESESDDENGTATASNGAAAKQRSEKNGHAGSEPAPRAASPASSSTSISIQSSTSTSLGQTSTNTSGDNLIEPDASQSSGIVNLDVTTLISLVSNVTNGYIASDFDDDLLQSQLQEERVQASLPVLLDFVRGKDVVVTQLAKEKLVNIVRIVGGPKEQARTRALFPDVTFEGNNEPVPLPPFPLRVIPNAPSERFLKVDGPRVKEQHRIIFGSGDALQATTTTANVHFVRTVNERNVPLSIFLHPARALTEQKESNHQGSTAM